MTSILSIHSNIYNKSSNYYSDSGFKKFNEDTNFVENLEENRYNIKTPINPKQYDFVKNQNINNNEMNLNSELLNSKTTTHNKNKKIKISNSNDYNINPKSTIISTSTLSDNTKNQLNDIQFENGYNDTLISKYRSEEYIMEVKTWKDHKSLYQIVQEKIDYSFFFNEIISDLNLGIFGSHLCKCFYQFLILVVVENKIMENPIILEASPFIKNFLNLILSNQNKKILLSKIFNYSFDKYISETNDFDSIIERYEYTLNSKEKYINDKINYPGFWLGVSDYKFISKMSNSACSNHIKNLGFVYNLHLIKPNLINSNNDTIKGYNLLHNKNHRPPITNSQNNDQQYIKVLEQNKISAHGEILNQTNSNNSYNKLQNNLMQQPKFIHYNFEQKSSQQNNHSSQKNHTVVFSINKKNL